MKSSNAFTLCFIFAGLIRTESMVERMKKLQKPLKPSIFAAPGARKAAEEGRKKELQELIKRAMRIIKQTANKMQAYLNRIREPGGESNLPAAIPITGLIVIEGAYQEALKACREEKRAEFCKVIEAAERCQGIVLNKSKTVRQMVEEIRVLDESLAKKYEDVDFVITASPEEGEIDTIDQSIIDAMYESYKIKMNFMHEAYSELAGTLANALEEDVVDKEGLDEDEEVLPELQTEEVAQEPVTAIEGNVDLEDVLEDESADVDEAGEEDAIIEQDHAKNEAIKQDHFEHESTDAEDNVEEDKIEEDGDDSEDASEEDMALHDSEAEVSSTIAEAGDLGSLSDVVPESTEASAKEEASDGTRSDESDIDDAEGVLSDHTADESTEVPEDNVEEDADDSEDTSEEDVEHAAPIEHLEEDAQSNDDKDLEAE